MAGLLHEIGHIYIINMCYSPTLVGPYWEKLYTLCLEYEGCTHDLGHSFSQYGPPGRWITCIYFFQEGTLTISAIWLILYAIRIFPFLPTSTVTLMWVFVLFFAKLFKCKSFFPKQHFIRQDSWKAKAFFSKQTYITILKWKKFLVTTSVHFLHLQSMV